MVLKPAQAVVPNASIRVSEGAGEGFGRSAGCAKFQAATGARGLQFSTAPSPLSQIISLVLFVCVVFAH